MKKKGSLFERKPYSLILAASTAVVWAFAFPLIKLGLAEFSVSSGDTGAKTLFAGVRFFAAGIIVIAAHFIFTSKDKREKPTPSAVWLALLLGVVNTALHYFFYYIGLSNQSGSRSAVIDSMSTFIILACAVFRDEHLTVKKIIGCALGFGGIMLVNAGGGSSEFTLSGDGMLILSAIFSALGGVLTRVATRKAAPAFVTGISLASGGVLLIVSGAAMGGRLGVPTAFGAFVLVCLILISVYGFTVYNKLLSCNPVGEIAIFNSLIPILGVTFSCLLLGEPFRLQYVAAGVLVAAGIIIINRSDTSEQDSASI